MKKFLKALFLNFTVLCVTLCISACEPKYETITQNAGNYKYGLDEKVEIIDIESNDILATLTIESCELVSDEPFVVLRQDGYADNGNDEKYKEVEFVALYKVTFSFNDVKEYVGDAQEHFYSEEAYFEINPTSEEYDSDTFFLGAKRGNNGDDTVSLSFTYDTVQKRRTALFEIPLDKVVPESSERGEIIRVSGEAPDNNKNDDASDFFGVVGVLSVIFGIAFIVVSLAFPILGVIGFSKSSSNKRKINQYSKKLDELENKVNYIDYYLRMSSMPKETTSFDVTSDNPEDGSSSAE